MASNRAAAAFGYAVVLLALASAVMSSPSRSIPSVASLTADDNGQNGQTGQIGQSGYPRTISTLQTELSKCASSLHDMNVTTDLEQATLLVANLTVSYIAYDRDNVNRTASSIAAYRRHDHPTPQDEEDARALPDEESEAMQTILADALAECQRVINGGPRPATGRPPASRLVVDDSTGLFADPYTGRHYFLLGYNEAPTPTNDTLQDSHVMGIETQDVSVAPKYLLPSPGNVSSDALDKIVASFRALDAADVRGTLFLGNGRQPGGFKTPGTQVMPDWAEQQYPNLTVNTGVTHFYSYDIDNPGARAVWRMTLQAVLPAIANITSFNAVSLANEPGFQAANSTYTLKGFQQFLSLRYNGSIEALNQAWRTNVTSFNDSNIVQAMGYKTFSTRQKLDWTTFNNQRVTAWYTFLHDTVHDILGKDRAVLVFLKADNSNSPLGYSHGFGIDRVALGQVLDMHGCDTRSFDGSSTHLAFPQWPWNTFAIDWLSITGSYDFMRSLDPSKPVVDTEWHTVSTVTFREAQMPAAHMTSATWLAHIHGLSLAEIWYWGRQDWTAASKISSEFGGADFAFSLMSQPQLMNAFVRTHVQANAISDLVAAVVTQVPQLLVLYSESSAIADRQYLNMQLAAYASASFLGVRLGFIPERLLVSSQLAKQTRILVPSVSYAHNSTVAFLSQHKNNVVLFGNETTRPHIFAFDDWGQPRDTEELKWLSQVPFVFTGPSISQATVDDLDKAMPQVDRTLTCLNASSSAQNRSPAFGIICRTAAWPSHDDDNFVRAGSDRHDQVLFISNLLARNATIDVAAIDSKALTLADAWTGAKVALPIQLQPLDSMFLRATTSSD